MSNPNSTWYRLRELIYLKYGRGRFALGCEITARWVAFETRRPCSMETVQTWCNLKTGELETETHELLMQTDQVRALLSLFGLKSTTELFNSNSFQL